jgi:hypothetical protein
VSKYEALPQFLQLLDATRRRMAFDEVERILGFKLPKSAYQYEAWWSNNETGHSHARAWLAVGWRTEEVDVAGRKVTFARAAGTSEVNPRARRKSDPWGCMAGTVTILPGTDLTTPTGEEWNAEKGVLLNE